MNIKVTAFTVSEKSSSFNTYVSGALKARFPEMFLLQTHYICLIGEITFQTDDMEIRYDFII